MLFRRLAQRATTHRRPLLVGAAFGAIYLVWGSTYLAIKIALESLPPFLLMGARSTVAGAALYLWARLRGAASPQRSRWRTGAIVGVLLFVGGHGGLAWSQQYVPSGVAALVVATIPIWMSLLEWRRSGVAPLARVWLGLGLGVAGVALLADPSDAFGGRPVDAIGLVVLVACSLAWAIGSIHARHAPLPDDPGLSAGMALLAGGASLLVIAGLAGQVASLPHVSARSAAALAYLIVLGSIVGFGAYVWLLRVSTPARVSTYAYVNPIVALTVGWAIAGEALSPRVLVAAAILLAGVAAIVSGPMRRADKVSSSKRESACLAGVEVKEA